MCGGRLTTPCMRSCRAAADALFSSLASATSASSTSSSSPGVVKAVGDGLSYVATMCVRFGARYEYASSVSCFNVALTMTVCRPPGTALPVCSLILAMSLRKLLANRSSASSTTNVFTPCVCKMPVRESSANLPGVPTTMSGRFRRIASSCLFAFAPPIACCVISRPRSPNNRSTCRTICIANSCDGATTSARTPFPASLRTVPVSSSTMSQITGSRYASVFPLPVCDCIATFSPRAIAGIAARCAIDGVSTPARSSARVSRAPTPRSLNVVRDAASAPSVVALGTHYRMGNVDPRMGAALAVGTALGGAFGSSFAVDAPRGALEAVFFFGMLFLSNRTFRSLRK